MCRASYLQILSAMCFGNAKLVDQVSTICMDVKVVCNTVVEGGISPHVSLIRIMALTSNPALFSGLAGPVGMPTDSMTNA